MRKFKSRGTGLYRASEAHQFLAHTKYGREGTRRGIIHVHGASGTASDTTTQLAALAAAGYPVISADLSAAAYSGSNWGNDDHIDAIGDAWAYLTSAFGAKVDAVGLYCRSMGAAGGLAWARANLGDCFAVACSAPVLDVDDVYQNNRGGWRASIGTAYGVTYPTSLGDLSTHSPVEFGATDLAGLPVRLWAVSNDAVASNTAAVTAWDGAGATKTVTDLGAIGHSGADAAITPQDVVQFFDDAGGRT